MARQTTECGGQCVVWCALLSCHTTAQHSAAAQCPPVARDVCLSLPLWLLRRYIEHSFLVGREYLNPLYIGTFTVEARASRPIPAFALCIPTSRDCGVGVASPPTKKRQSRARPVFTSGAQVILRDLAGLTGT